MHASVLFRFFEQPTSHLNDDSDEEEDVSDEDEDSSEGHSALEGSRYKEEASSSTRRESDVSMNG